MITVNSYCLRGTEAVPVTVEVDLVNRLPSTVIVGMSAGSVRETAERVRSAIEAAGFEYPRKRVVVTIQPEGIFPRGYSLDLAIAMGILQADGQLDEVQGDKARAYVGELSLSGQVRKVRGSVAMAEHAAAHGLELLGAGVLGDLRPIERFEPDSSPPEQALDFSDIRGNLDAIEPLLSAVRSGKPILFVGPPGCGKTMFAVRMRTLLPQLTPSEQTELACIHDAAGFDINRTKPIDVPFRAPHHSISIAGMIGSSTLYPGEVTLAHRGVLYLDEIGEFTVAALDAMWRAYEDGSVTRSTMGQPRIVMPSQFMLVAGLQDRPATSTMKAMVDRFAIVEIETVDDIVNAKRWPTSAELRERL